MASCKVSTLPGEIAQKMSIMCFKRHIKGAAELPDGNLAALELTINALHGTLDPLQTGAIT